MYTLSGMCRGFGGCGPFFITLERDIDQVVEREDKPRSRGNSPVDRRSPQRSDGAHLGWTALCSSSAFAVNKTKTVCVVLVCILREA